MKTSYQSRLTAASIHFLASLTLFSVLLFVIINIWYPQPYFSASGGWQGLKIVAFVDLVLGPVITFVIFNANKSKRELVTDLSIIVIIQLTALFYGIHTIYSQRPVALAFWENKFYTVTANTFKEQEISLKTLNQFSEHSPAMVYVEKPISIIEKKAMLRVITEKKIPPMEQINRYRSIKSHISDIIPNSIDINEVITVNTDMAEQLQTLLKQTQTKQKENFYLVLESIYQNTILVFSAKYEVIGFLKAPLKKE